MAEEVVTTTSEMETQTILVPKFIKKEAVGKKKTVFKSDIFITAIHYCTILEVFNSKVISKNRRNYSFTCIHN